MESLLTSSWSPEAFKSSGHKLIDRLAVLLQQSQTNQDFKTIHWASPNDQLDFWQNDFDPDGGDDPFAIFEKIINRSILLCSPRYLGHQVPPTLPVTVLSSAVMAFLNNGMAVYEMGMAGNAMERVIIDYLASRFGLASDAGGFITSGGSLGNLTALLAARAAYLEGNEYMSGELAVMVSSEAHYSIGRACAIMGIKQENIIKIPVGKDFSILPDTLESCYQEANVRGKKVFCIIGCCCSTATGSYDDLIAVGDFAKEKGIWFHADGAHGGAAIFSSTYSGLLKGIQWADSIILDFHKLLLVPSLSTAIIFRSRKKSRLAFTQKAAYLWEDQEKDEWYNSGKQTFECTKPMTVVHIYTILKVYGARLYEQYIDEVYGLSKIFAEMIDQHPDLELALWPQSNIICFRHRDHKERVNLMNKAIVERLTKDGKFYIVGTMLNDQFYLRTSIMNPLTQRAQLEQLIMEISANAQNILQQ